MPRGIKSQGGDPGVFAGGNKYGGYSGSNMRSDPNLEGVHGQPGDEQ